MNPKKILVIRRDNIGDLVCTTPALAALHARFPDAQVDVLVNDYNAPVLAGNPDINRVWVYRKAKHRAEGESRLGIWLATAAMMWRIRQECYDVAIVATPTFSRSSYKFARHVRAARIVAAASGFAGIRDPAPLDDRLGRHEAEAVMALLKPLGIDGAPGPCKVVPTAAEESQAGPLIGLHLSARKSSQRWPVESYANLAGQLHDRFGARFLLFWAPGAHNAPRHPGDDDKAKEMLRLTTNLPVKPCATHTLPELIAGLSRCTRIICSDGGAMHLAAGLGKPILCFFGNSSAEHWYPWGVPHELLQPDSRDVGDISVEDALTAYERLSSRLA